MQYMMGICHTLGISHGLNKSLLLDLPFFNINKKCSISCPTYMDDAPLHHLEPISKLVNCIHDFDDWMSKKHFTAK